MNHQDAKREVQAAFVAGRAVAPEVQAHVDSCEQCAAVAGSVLQLERVMEGGAPMGARALRQVEDAVLAGMRPVRRRWWPRVFAVLLPALAAGAFLLGTPMLRRHDGFAARGAAVPWVRLTCVSDGGVRAEVRTAATAAPALECQLADVLLVSVNGKDPSLPYVFVVGRTPAGEARWYAPRPSQPGSIKLAADAPGEQPVAAVKLGVNHQAGPVEVLAIFSSAPVDTAAVRAALALEDPATALPASSQVQRAQVVLQ